MTRPEKQIVEAWYRYKPKWRKAEDLLKALPRTEIDRNDSNKPDFITTHDRIKEACYQAAHYDPKNDPGLNYRKKMASQGEQRVQLASAARILANACQRDDTIMMWALASATKNRLDATLIEGGASTGAKLTDVGEAWFRAIEKLLTKPEKVKEKIWDKKKGRDIGVEMERGMLHQIDGGPFLQRFTCGNLLFDTFQGGVGTNTLVGSMLAFELTLYLRLHTAGRAQYRLQDGELMPGGRLKTWEKDEVMLPAGRPCAHVVAAFVSATLADGCVKKTIEDRLSGISASTGLTGWPDAPDPDNWYQNF